MAKVFNKKSWLINQLRRLTLKYPPATRAKNRTKEEYFILSKKGKPMRRVKFTCEQCGTKNLKSKQVELDHTIPVVCPKTGFVNWDTYLNRLFCNTEEDYKILCLQCHGAKTLAEDIIREEYKTEPEKSPKKVKKST